MRLLIHDLEEARFKELLPGTIDNIIIVSGDEEAHNCIGCFGCWIKTPGACVIRDKFGDMGEHLSKCNEVIIISKCFYGGFSPLVKTILDRSISYIHPYFEIRNREMHHRSRYMNQIDMKVWFYGENITKQEKQTAEKLVKANAINLNCCTHEVRFVEGISEFEHFDSLTTIYKEAEVGVSI